jgi:ferrochelatase
LPECGLLLLNLGTPQSPSVAHVRRYLREFLMDPKVIDIAYPLRLLLVHGIIAPFRAPRSAEAYRSIWSNGKSPLLSHSESLAAALQPLLDMPIELAMRYGTPSVKGALLSLADVGVKSLTVLPLFPHYAMSSYESAVEAVLSQAIRLDMQVRVIQPFYSDPGYISSLVSVALPFLRKQDHLLFSFHGIPERHLRKTDPTGSTCLRSPACCAQTNPAHATCYRHQCLVTAARFAATAGLAENFYSVAFQSSLGRDQWLKPATDKHLHSLAQEGHKHLAVICPSFTADCLETLEEIGIRGRKTFLDAGGERFTLIPCLNDHPSWAGEIARLVTGRVPAPLLSLS